MAGIEQLEIHSRSYIVRWIRVDEDHTISWSVQPHKKSINFGIVKHPGSANNTSLTLSQFEETSFSTVPDDTTTPYTPNLNDKAKDLLSRATNPPSTAEAPLLKKGFIPVTWHGRCEADKVTVGTYDVPHGQGGMYGLVFDNSFSKQTSKTATFVLLMYPIGSPPQTTNSQPNLRGVSNASASRKSLVGSGVGGRASPRLGASGPGASDSVDSLGSQKTRGRKRSDAEMSTGDYHMGVLMKRRRKKGQGYARRYFSLDYATCTLSYYHDRNSSALRGAIPLSLAAIAADERRREISIDSGAEIWHLKATSDKEFTGWARALEKSSRIARGLEAAASTRSVEEGTGPRVRRSIKAAPNNAVEEDREWQQVEALVSRVVGTRDALRRLIKDMAAQKYPHPHVTGASASHPGTPNISEDAGYFGGAPAAEKRPFWRRKSSAPASSTVTTPIMHNLTVPSPSSLSNVVDANGMRRGHQKTKSFAQEERTIQNHCTALLGDLDSVVLEFTNLLSNSKLRRQPAPLLAGPRASMESNSTEEFFDAEAGGEDRSALMIIKNEDGGAVSDVDEASFHDASSVESDDDEDSRFSRPGSSSSIFPIKPKSLIPLPIESIIKRRRTIPPSTVLPPSLIAFVRKNVGKDLSTISMPVSANEPESLLQRVAEQLEYANLLDAAAKQNSATDRLLFVTAFAISQFSVNRAKERAIRKPFNPLLGETFELIRGDKETPGGFRLLVEKVTHRPVRLAMQADAASWSFAQSPAPTQKFWGKSAELTTEGRVRVVLRLLGRDGGDDGEEERYSWTIATMFLRNVVMGEKYLEPVGSMTVVNETSNARANVEFRSKGMFGGRGEEVHVDTFASDGSHGGSGLVGTWTTSLKVVDASKNPGREIWRAGELVDNAAQTYGMTRFAATLNEITLIEEGKIPITDTRLRPDQRLAEEGKLDDAEIWKTRLEEAQRARRRLLEERGDEHKPRWFTKAATGQDGEEVWKLKPGKEGYWEERAKGDWTGVEDIFVV